MKFGSLKTLSLFYTERFMDHDTGQVHPESPLRVQAIVDQIKKASFADKVHCITPQPAETKWLETIHTPSYRQFIEESALSGKSTVDHGETLISHESYEVALLAIGSALEGIDRLVSGSSRRVFVCGRPPGHHARSEQAMGFCLFNTVAIAARYAQIKHGIKRIGVFDFDVHHGNGTQEAFYNDPSVLFCSIHELPLYPHTGEYYETGSGDGKGTTLNSPIRAGATIKDYRRAWKEDFSDKLESFEPELLLISAGFDAHKKDPLANVNLETEDFHEITSWLVDLANRHCSGRILSILEGGYDLEALAHSATAHVAALLNKTLD